MLIESICIDYCIGTTILLFLEYVFDEHEGVVRVGTDDDVDAIDVLDKDVTQLSKVLEIAVRGRCLQSKSDTEMIKYMIYRNYP